MKTPRLREWRESKGETQLTLSERSGVAEHTISRIEHGAELRPTTARKLADALDVEVADLMESPPVASLAGAGKGEAPPETGPSLLERAQDAARRDEEKVSRATSRLFASEGVLPNTNITEFEEDKFRAELRALGFPDEYFEDFLWPLIVKANRADLLEAELTKIMKQLEENQAEVAHETARLTLTESQKRS